MQPHVCLFQHPILGPSSIHHPPRGIHLLLRGLVVRVDLIVPEQSLRIVLVSLNLSDQEHSIAEGLPTLSPSPQKKFFVRMFMYGYSVLSSIGGSCDLCSQCSSHSLHAFTPAIIRAGMVT